MRLWPWNAKKYILLSLAEGSIEAGPEQQERLDEFTKRVQSGEFHIPVTDIVPTHCIDGRHGAKTIGVDSAGGTESLFVADDLTFKDFVGIDSTTAAGFSRTIDELVRKGYPVGGHDDNHAEKDVSWCGANDKLSSIYNFIIRHANVIRGLAEQLGVKVDDETHNLIVSNATARTEFSGGIKLLGVLKATPEASIDHLENEHQEVIVVINTKTGTSLDRNALAAEFGAHYQAFEVDAWAFVESTAVISKTPEDAAKKAIAMVYYNLATAYVLCGPSMRVITI